MELTTSRVNRAGRTLRRWMEQPGRPADSDVREALDVLAAFRAAHARPLTAVRDALRAALLAEGCAVDVSERLKRADTILDKLLRQPGMALSRMQDIGGCRAVVTNVEVLRRVQARLVRELEPIRTDDYIERPRSSGYRAVHLVVRLEDRQIEIQLRTRLMHVWAMTVEAASGQSGRDLKSGAGPSHALERLERLADTFAEIEGSGSLAEGDVIARLVDDALR